MRPVKIKPSQSFPGPAGSEVAAALPSPGPDAEPTEQVLDHLLGGRACGWRESSVRPVLAGARARSPSHRGETTRCTVTFEGVTVPWLVTSKGMTSGSLGSFVSQDFIYTARALKSVHTAQSIYDLYAGETGKNGTTEGPPAPVDPRCDRLPGTCSPPNPDRTPATTARTSMNPASTASSASSGLTGLSTSTKTAASRSAPGERLAMTWSMPGGRRRCLTSSALPEEGCSRVHHPAAPEPAPRSGRRLGAGAER